MAQLRQSLIPAISGQFTIGRLCVGIAVIVGSTFSGFSSLNAEENPRKRSVKSSDTGNETAAEHPLMKPLKILRRSRKTLDGVQDYTATFSKKERLGRNGNKLLAQTMKMKFRDAPFSVYFYFQDRETRGREALYVNGRNEGKLLVHEGSGLSSLVGTLSFAPNHGDVMKENRYPITEVGLKNMADKIIEQWDRETEYGETTVKYYNNAKLGSVDCMAIESTHPQPRKEFKYHITRVYIDKKSKLVVRIEQYGWPRRAGQQPPIIEEYTYSDINLNVGLTDADFDHRNKSYKF